VRERVVAGIVAGAVGTLALDAVSYGDMALRGRPPSAVPADTLGVMLRRRGIAAASDDDERARHRVSALAALGGYAVGVSIGALYAWAAPVMRRVPFAVRAVTAGTAAMAAGNAGPIMAGTTDPGEWGVAGWISDVVPHLAYGVAAAAAFDAVTRPTSRDA
jgi:hypothetical protein